MKMRRIVKIAEGAMDVKNKQSPLQPVRRVKQSSTVDLNVNGDIGNSTKSCAQRSSS